jgi:sugar phosphate isomerase/epimerase
MKIGLTAVVAARVSFLPEKQRRLRMRLGVAFWEGVDPQHPERAVERLDTIGVKGVVLVPGKDGWTDEELRRLGETFDSRGVFVAEVAQYRHGLLASHDDKMRREGIESVKKSLRDARALNAHCTGLGTVAEGDWWSEKTWKRLVEGTKEVAEEAERLRVDIAFHPTNHNPLDTPEQLRRIVDEVGSPRVKVMLDPVNMITHRTSYDTTRFLNQTFDLIGDVIIGAHAKDVSLDPSHWVLRIDEVPPGKGSLDYETFLRRMASLDRDVVLIIEHVRDAAISGSTKSPNYVEYSGTDFETIRAKQHIQDVAQRVGVMFD